MATAQEETEETTAQEMDKALPDASLHDCHVAMVPLKDIYVESDPHDEDLVTALADSICHIGLQHPICVVKNDLPEHDTPYRIVSGRQRYQAYKSLGRENIPCHMLTYDEEEFANEKKRLAQYEENLLRKQLTLIETCTSLGKAKEAYLTMYPETDPGKASPKNPGTGRLPYARVASQMLGKSKSTIEKYLQIYQNVLKPFAEEVAEAQHNTDIFTSVEQLASLAQEPPKDIPILLTIIANPDEDVRGLQDAIEILEEERAEHACGGEGQPQTLSAPATVPKSASTPTQPVRPPGTETVTQVGAAPEQPNSTPLVSAKPSGKKPVPAPSPLQDWLARVHDFGAQFSAIVARYYAEKDANKAAVFLKYRNEIRHTVQHMFPSVSDQNSLHRHWYHDSENRVDCSFTYESKDPRYELRLHFSLTKAVHSKSR